jgi:hypothetical protein
LIAFVILTSQARSLTNSINSAATKYLLPFASRTPRTCRQPIYRQITTTGMLLPQPLRLRGASNIVMNTFLNMMRSICLQLKFAPACSFCQSQQRKTFLPNRR